jgi:hypothetical protein
MPQNPNAVYPAVNGGVAKPLNVDANGNLQVTVEAAPAAEHTLTTATGTITADATFRSALAANAARVCAVISNNDAAADMQVFFGAVASASVAKAMVLPAKSQLSTVALFGAGVTYTGAIAIAGTKDDIFSTVEVTTAA